MEVLSYPLDSKYILRKKRSIKKTLLESENLVEKKVAILGGSTTSEIKNILELFLLNIGVRPVFYESDFNRFYEDAVFRNDELDKFQPEIVYVHSTNKNISVYPEISTSTEDVEKLLKSEVERFSSVWEGLNRFSCVIIQNNFDFPTHRKLGNFDAVSDSGAVNYITKLNLMLSEELNKRKNVYLNDINYLSSRIGLENWFDLSLWYNAKYALSFSSIPELCFNISHIVNAILGKTKKCLVLDLDNTCWGGVIGDDGLSGILIGDEDPVGEAHTLLQKYAKSLKQRGIMLSVCSKNDFENAKSGFSHPRTELSFDDFVSFKANWEPKHLNIIEIAQDINIGKDSLVFIDDNPMERGLVSAQLPEVSVPDVGSDIVNYVDHIDRNGYFEALSLSDDDIKRNQYYADNLKRKSETAQYKNYDEFLKSMEMKGEIRPFSSLYMERITQLTNKTNQFNLTTKRYTLSEIEDMANSSSHITLYGKLADKYGDNGLISLIAGHIEEDTLHVDLWLMSCRVLKRDMEFAMCDQLIDMCLQRSVSKIIGYYYKTAKNNMVSELFAKLGFEKENSNENGDTVWSLDIKNYENKNKFIEVNNE